MPQRVPRCWNCQLTLIPARLTVCQCSGGQAPSANTRIGKQTVKFKRNSQQWRFDEILVNTKDNLETLAFEKNYRVDALCEYFGCSQRHLHSLFLRDLGMSPKCWLDQQRMMVARRLLLGGATIHEVAGVLGYSSVVAFNRRFVLSWGMPPGRYARDIQLAAGDDQPLAGVDQ